ncbi:MAG: very short patch repair endonuclease [Patescibacteria group bacterium]|nr:very short patch repair endonuclease [Patescibacteria group bacterium]
MTDKITKSARSSLMSKIKSKDTKLEKSVRKILSGKGIKYRKNSSKYFGKPDIIIASKKIVIFVDSCFWHGCKKHYRIPESNRDYWVNKINNNKKRDKLVSLYYKKAGWKIIRIWEHALKNSNRINDLFNF